MYLDPRTQTLIPFNQSRSVDARAQRDDKCPTCGRSYHTAPSTSPQNDDISSREDEPNFITNDYFQMLARSLPGSAQPSAPPSPRRRLAQPVRSRLGSPVTATPPPDAEFIGSSPAPPSGANGISETAFAPQYFEKFFTVERELGRGGRGVVLLVRHTLDGVPLGHFACKRVPIGDDHSWLEKVLVEVQLLTQLSHQNLVSYRHVWLEDFQINAFSPSVPCAFILQQYCNGGDLHNYICGSAQSTMSTQQLKERIRRRSRGESELPRKKDEPRRLQFEEIYNFFRDITAGLRFLHLNSFVHRDLKPSNCLLHTTGHETRVLVSDFGEVQYEYAARRSTGATGTISYCAPEVLQRVSANGPFGNFTFKSDIFSLGMILHFLCFANLPYMAANVLHEEREDVDKLRAEIVAWQGFDDQKKIRPDLPNELYPFLKRLISVNQDLRPTAEEVHNGISLGRLSEAMPQLHRRGSATAEELTPGRRIQKIDTPQQGNSPHRGAGLGLEVGAIGGLRSMRSLHPRRSRSRERRRSQPSKLSLDTAIEDDSPSPDPNPDHEPLSSSLTLRPTVASALPSPTRSPTPSFHPLNPSTEHQQLLLPPPSPHRSFLSHLLRISTPSTAIRATILTIKLLSTLQPCMTHGMNAVTVYPLLALAILEFTLTPLQLWEVVLFGITHITALTLARRYNALCAPRTGEMEWRWDES